uniref:GTPase Der n=1 Tax=Ananas comosus var. bracteatus TaxID=296719 RepID=A0A6V7NUQ0_ANACO|nr:unnamed protein product [Ananas comosus var. bracteatus]
MELPDIDWRRVVSRFARDEAYENIDAPMWVDLSAPDASPAVDDDDAWFCRPDCRHPKTAEDFLKPKAPSLQGRLMRSSSEKLPLGERNADPTRDANSLKRRGAIGEGLRSKAGVAGASRNFREDLENQNPNTPTPPRAARPFGGVPKGARNAKSAIKSSAEKKKKKEEAATGATEEYEGRKRVERSENEIKKLAVGVRRRSAAAAAEGEEERVKQERMDLSESIRKADNGSGKKSTRMAVRVETAKEKGKFGLDEKSPLVLREVRASPPTPQRFPSPSSYRLRHAKAAATTSSPLKRPPRATQERGSILEEMEQSKIRKKAVATKDEECSSRASAASDSAGSGDMLWFFKPCTYLHIFSLSTPHYLLLLSLASPPSPLSSSSSSSSTPLPKRKPFALSPPPSAPSPLPLPPPLSRSAALRRGEIDEVDDDDGDEEEEDMAQLDVESMEEEAMDVARDYSLSLSRELRFEDDIDEKKRSVSRKNRGGVPLNMLGNRAIVVDEPGVTRDRLYGRSFWGDQEFMVVDTGGVMTFSKSQADVMEELAITTTIGMDGIPLASREAAVARMPSMIERQATAAIEEASVIIFLVDGQAGLVAADVEIADWLRKNYSHKCIILAVNKCESPRKGLMQASEFWSLGFSPLPISAVSGSGTGELLNLVCSELKNIEDMDNDEEEESYVPSIAIVGRPNVGKSSILNALVGEDRTIVSPVSGTTRDAIDTEFTGQDGQKYRLIDTAGIRRRAAVASAGSTTEALSVNRAFRAIRRSDVVALVIEALACITEQDCRIAERIEREGKGLGTSILNQVVQEALAFKPPPRTRGGKRGRIYYTTQAAVCPPTFVFFVNDAKLFPETYRRYMEKQLRSDAGFAGTPIRLLWRSRRRPDKEGKAADGNAQSARSAGKLAVAT